ncbi:UbiX family flavin prenyltransferase [Vicingaceae bacterium]|nr:UbiX family flavin prenyltransferase [Vicingaceae bacterium]
MKDPIVLGISGASGAVYARRLLEVLLETDEIVHLVVSPAAALVFKQEIDVDLDVDNFQLEKLLPGVKPKPGHLHYHRLSDYMTPIASGSFRTKAMIVCPCSGGTLSAIVTGASRNLIHRAADVHLKERRPLILVPRETPLSTIQLENMHKASMAGATVLPASPGWYHGVESLSDLIDFIVARILDHLEIDHSLMRRWGE